MNILHWIIRITTDIFSLLRHGFLSLWKTYMSIFYLFLLFFSLYGYYLSVTNNNFDRSVSIFVQCKFLSINLHSVQSDSPIILISIADKLNI